MELKFSITNQTLKRVDENKPVEKSQDYLYCYFDFSTNDWEKATNKYAIFSNEEYNDEKGNALAYEIIDNKCLVPNEILNSNELSFKVNVVGTNESGLYILPTSVEYVRLNKTGSLDGMQPSENAPTIYQKLASEVNASFSDLTYEFNRDSGKLKLNFISNDKSVKSFEVDLPTEELVKNVEYDVDNSQLIIEWENGQTTNIPMSSVVSTPSMIEITYEELKALKDNNELIVGQKYRIIDYETTTIQYETQSAGHPFDIIVTATSENTFDENASACVRKGDKYFGTWYEEIEIVTGEFLDNVTPESIEVLYTIYVDEFGEANNKYTDGGLKNGADQIVEIGYAENNGGIEVPVFYKNDVGFIESGEEGTDYQDTFFYVGTEEIDGVVYDKWRKIESGGTYVWDNNTKIFVLTNQVVRKTQSEVSTITHKGKPLESWGIKYCFDNDNERYGWVPNEFMVYTDDTCWFKRDGEFEYNGTKYYKWVSPQMGDNEFLLSQTLELNVGDMLDHYFIEEDVFETEYSTIEKTTNAGKGVIYYMKDEWNNECPYDFKNIMFNGFFTFHFNDGNDNLDGTMQTFKNDEGLETHFMDNSIDTFQESVYEDGTIRYAIPYGNTFIVNLESANDFRVCRNKLGKNCSYNEFGNYCHDNILNDDCSRNSFNKDKNDITLGRSCGNNEFREQCYHITLGNNSNGNIIWSSGFFSTGTEFEGNTINTSVKYTTFGNKIYNNIFSKISNSTFGNNVSRNTFEYTVDGCSFGNNITDNEFEGIYYELNNCNFGNGFVDNHFRCSVISSTFGNDVTSNKIWCGVISNSQFGNYFDSNEFNGEFDEGISSSQFGNYVDGNIFHYDVVATNIGDSFSSNKVHKGFLGCIFGNVVRGNIFNEEINYSTFGNNILQNVFNTVSGSSFGNEIAENTVTGRILDCSFGNTIKNNTFNKQVWSSSFGNGIYYSSFNGIEYSSIASRITYSEFCNITASIIGNDTFSVSLNREDGKTSFIVVNISNHIYGKDAYEDGKLKIFVPDLGKTKINIDQDQQGQILMYWNDDKLKKVGYYLESNSSTEWLPLEDYADTKAKEILSILDDTSNAHINNITKQYASGYSSEDISSNYTWEEATSPITNRSRSCCYGNGYYVVAGTSGDLAYSTDSITWAKLTPFTSNVITGIAYGNGKFLAVDSGGNIWSCNLVPNGTWKTIYTTSIILEAMRFINDKFFVVGQGGFLAYSIDGATWYELNSNIETDLIDITYGNGKYIAVGLSGGMTYSLNGQEWYNITNSEFTTSYRHITYGKEMFVAGGQNGVVRYSHDGINWQNGTHNSSSTIGWIRGFAYNSGRFYSVNYTTSGTGEVWYSVDGINWEVVYSTSGRLWCLCVDSNGIFITSGENGKIYKLDLGIEWLASEPTSEHKYYRFILSKNNGNEVYSENYYQPSSAGGKLYRHYLLIGANYGSFICGYEKQFTLDTLQNYLIDKSYDSASTGLQLQAHDLVGTNVHYLTLYYSTAFETIKVVKVKPNFTLESDTQTITMSFTKTEENLSGSLVDFVKEL